MANKDHIKRLKTGVDVWNAWRRIERKYEIYPNLNKANLAGAKLFGADLAYTNLDHTNLSDADLRHADLLEASLVGADLTAADVRSASFHVTNLRHADFTGAALDMSYFLECDFDGAVLTHAHLAATVFSDVDLSQIIGLEKCVFDGPSVVDHLTLQKSGPLPLAFLRGVGLPDMLIDYLPSLLNQAIQHYSCFISYSTKNQEFTDRLYADLQNKGVRCWFAPHDMPIGGKILDEIDAGIRLRDKVLLILSEHSIKSEWVEDEVTKGFEEERKRGQTVLFPVRLDDSVMDTDEPWAAKLRARHIGDFRRWKKHDAYKNGFERVLRDLTVKKASE